MRVLLLISSILIHLLCFGQIKIGSYAQPNGNDFVYLNILPSHKFNFYDTRHGSCWLWNKYEGQWTYQKDTLTLKFNWKYLIVEDSINFTSKDVDYLEIKRFLVKKENLVFIDGTGKDLIPNWGNFRISKKKTGR
jgi:hypothetical protein